MSRNETPRDSFSIRSHAEKPKAEARPQRTFSAPIMKSATAVIRHAPRNRVPCGTGSSADEKSGDIAYTMSGSMPDKAKEANVMRASRMEPPSSIGAPCGNPSSSAIITFTKR